MVALALLLALLVLRMRYIAEHVDWLEFSGIAVFSLVVVGAGCWIFAKKHFESVEQSLVRLESDLGLNNALSSARAGVRAWPDVPEGASVKVQWQWPRMVLPLLGGSCLLTSSAFIPIGERGKEVYTVAAPKGFTDLAESIEELDLNEVVDEEYIEEIEEKMEELSDANSEDWFSHASLEAIDSLRESHQNNAAQLEQDMRKSERALQVLSKKDAKLSQEDKERLLNEFGQALDSMNSGAMKPNKELMDKLKALDPKALEGIPKEQLEEMRQKMREHAERLDQQQKKNGGDIGDEPGEMEGEGQGEGNGEGEGEGFGNGGINRGPGHPPGVLGDELDPLETGDMQGIDPKTLDDALPGDLLETRSTEHDVDKSATSAQAGGGLKSESRGGERVWQSELLPDEQKALKKFFK
jgi:hypothetical protein